MTIDLAAESGAQSSTRSIARLDRPARAGETADWPGWLPAAAVAALRAEGVAAPWRHQVEAAEAVHAGRHTVIATPTASGKSLGYLMPLIAAALDGTGRVPDADDPVVRIRGHRTPTALYLAPTKALAHDQRASCERLAIPRWRVSTLDGDSDDAERRFARQHASLVLTNPDLLHRSVLPNHQRWGRLLRDLQFIVVDEAHRYRGVFGAHVAAVLRRLRRLAIHHGADPVLVLASATTADPAGHAARLTGVAAEDVVAITRSTAPTGRLSITLRAPERSTDDDTIAEVTERVLAGEQVLAFVPSRNRAELVAQRCQQRVAADRGELATDGLPWVEPYRSGFLDTERRGIEARLRSGSVRAVAATNALELGIDVAGLDAVVIAGFPPTLSAFWQQAGRAGRRGTDAAVSVIAGENPLDGYLLDHPEQVFSGAVEASILHPDNPYVLGPHLAAAAQELTLTEADQRFFGPTMPTIVDRLATQGVLRRRAQGWFWTRSDRAVDAIDLRSAGGAQVEIVERGTGRLLGSVDAGGADRTVHEGAVYLHHGETWLVHDYDDEDRVADVSRCRLPWWTQSRGTSEVSVLTTRRSRPFGAAMLHEGEVQVASRVTDFLRRDSETGAVLGSHPLDLPRRTMTTRAMWLTVPSEVLAGFGWNDLLIGSAAHAAEHTAIGLLSAFAPCDRWDIGGLSTALHPDTGECTIFVHDGQPGGAGFAERGFEVADEWWAATLERLEHCDCENGCPACVMSPKCGNGNEFLDKSAAAALLAAVLPARP